MARDYSSDECQWAGGSLNLHPLCHDQKFKLPRVPESLSRLEHGVLVEKFKPSYRKKCDHQTSDTCPLVQHTSLVAGRCARELAATEEKEMLLAAALLAVSFPQAMPSVVTDSPSAPAPVVEVAKTDAAKSDSASTATLPAAPAPKIAADSAAANGESSSLSAEAIQPATPIQPANPPKPAIRGIRYETPRQKVAWIGLSIAGHGTAAFDAYSTRRALSGGYRSEANPLLRPFAHSNAIYVATQVSPTLMDYFGHKMMTNRRPWVRKMWWLPQAAGAGLSFTAGMHNMSLVK